MSLPKQEKNEGPLTPLFPGVTSLCHEMEQFAEIIRSCGFPCRGFSQESLGKFNQLTPEKQNQIVSQWRSYCELVANGQKKIVYNVAYEKQRLEKVFKRLSLIVDDEFWSALEEGDLVEIYNDQMVQIYRSVNFFEACRYSLLDLSVNEWYVLWERPSSVIEFLTKSVQEVMSGQKGFGRLEAPKHLVREILNSGQTEPFVPHAVLLDFKFISPLKTWDREIKGFVVTSRVECVSDSEKSENIVFM